MGSWPSASSCPKLLSTSSPNSGGPVPLSSVPSPERWCCQATLSQSFIIFVVILGKGDRRERELSSIQPWKPPSRGGKGWGAHVHVPGRDRQGWGSGLAHLAQETASHRMDRCLSQDLGGRGIGECKGVSSAEAQGPRPLQKPGALWGSMALSPPGLAAPLPPLPTSVSLTGPGGAQHKPWHLGGDGADGGRGGGGGSQVMFGKAESTACEGKCFCV